MKRASILGVIAGVVAIPALWIAWPTIFGLSEINSAIKEIEKFDPTIQITEKATFGANTFTDECSSSAIKSAYNRAASTLASKDSEVATYAWLDQLGWDRVSTVLQLPSGYVEVRASCNNDNDSVYIGFIPGTFDKPDMKRLDGFELPIGILRCDWNQ